MKQGNEVVSSGRSRAHGGTMAKGQRAPTPPASGMSGPASNEERARLIAEAAYYRAQARGFEPGQELEDWLQAEVEIDRALRGG